MATATWHKELTKRGSSNSSNLNFLWQHPTQPIYVMDNHLAALWCWLREIEPGEACSLLHVDLHFNLARPSEKLNERLRAWDAGDDKSLDSFLALRAPDNKEALARWDNYIRPFTAVRDLKSGRTWCHESADKADPWPERFTKGVDDDLLTHLVHAHTYADTPTVVWNLDLDFFFLTDLVDKPNDLTEFVQAYSDEFVRCVAERIYENFDEKRDVLTIALSPECCGGWSEAERVLGLVSSAMKLGIILPAT